VPREPQRLALDDQVMADADGLVPQAIPRVRVGPDEIRSGHTALLPVYFGQERIEAVVQLRQPVEDLLEPFPRSSKRLCLRLPDVLLDGGEAVGSAPVSPAGGAQEVVPPQFHAGAPLARW
jgi:hypothetical protein